MYMILGSQDFIEMDREDEQTGRMKDIHMQLLTAYCQLPLPTTNTEETYYDDSVAGDAHNQVTIWTLYIYVYIKQWFRLKITWTAIL